MFSITKILCLGAIGNYFMAIQVLSQIRSSEYHRNITGMTHQSHCGAIHPSLPLLDSISHYGLAIEPFPLGLKELSSVGMCLDMLRDQEVNIHLNSRMLRIEPMTLFHGEISTSWKPYDMPFITGLGLHCESIGFDDGILYCTSIDMQLGALMNIDDAARIAVLFQYPLSKPNEEHFAPIYSNPLLTIGCGFNPIDPLSLDVDFIHNQYTSGLRTGVSCKISEYLSSRIGFSLPHSAGTIGFSMLLDDIFVETEVFNHLYLGYSWYIGIRYYPGNTP
jgi:hypothetical protein